MAFVEAAVAVLVEAAVVVEVLVIWGAHAVVQPQFDVVRLLCSRRGGHDHVHGF